MCFSSEIPVGVLTTLIGGPFFLYLLSEETKEEAVWGRYMNKELIKSKTILVLATVRVKILESPEFR